MTTAPNTAIIPDWDGGSQTALPSVTGGTQEFQPYPVRELKTSPPLTGITKDLKLESSDRVTPIDAITIGELPYKDADRSTTVLESLIGELRGWRLLAANWDGEGADVPDARSLKEAVAFARLLGEKDALPEPMLHASGHAGLFWKNFGLYADIEFLGDNRIAYYIERRGDKHKGVVKFDSRNMPDVFQVLLPA